jgi:hypothetical protein
LPLSVDEEASGEEADCGEAASSALAAAPPRGGWAAGGGAFALLLRAWALNQLAFSYLFVGEHDAALAALDASTETCARIVAQEGGGGGEDGARRGKEKTEETGDVAQAGGEGEEGGGGQGEEGGGGGGCGWRESDCGSEFVVGGVLMAAREMQVVADVHRMQVHLNGTSCPAYVCVRMLTCADVCVRMLTYADGC